MESAERFSLPSSRTLSSSASCRGEPRRGRIRSKGPATATGHFLGPRQLPIFLLPLFLPLALLASPAVIGPVAVFAQLSTDVEPSLNSMVEATDVEPNLNSMVDEGSLCNTTVYGDWYNLPYSGVLLVDLVDFWIFSDAELTNGQALEVVSSSCRIMMDTLRLDRAGRNGPVADKYIHDIMCADECTLSDAIRQEAMELSSCTCLQLSTQPSDPTYHTAGDWCVANSGRILCETFGQCGAWDCRISDFMCPRYEYNKQEVLHRGKGDCSGAKGGRRGPLEHAATTTTSLLTCAAMAALQWYRR